MLEIYYYGGLMKNKTENENYKYKANKALTWVGSAILIVSSLYLIIWKTFNDVVTTSVLIGAMFFIISFFTYLGMDKPRDERLMKVGTTAVTWSWSITLSFMCFLLYFGFIGHRNFQVPEIFGLQIFVMVSTMLVLNTYFNFKGDVDEIFPL